MSDESNTLLAVVVTRLENLTTLCEKSFDQLIGRVSKLETEVAGLREYRARMESREEERARVAKELDDAGRDWTKITLAALGIAGTAIAALTQVPH